ncbi:helix-turn-helix transcriptional regulator [Pectobacterium fontis]|uniref:Arabinose operon regulatory protein n=1 Tax=Pectobacterium fontis TaxID=2558042 RepID=A0A7V8IN63_9GAMM|nr:AraC family transcriptional regulator [Pectobacterium fontis]KHN55367.1 AraC family transcriptional regulator [Pectobacterium fontis]
MMTYRDAWFELALLTNGRRFPRHTHDEFVISANLSGVETVWLDGETFVATNDRVTTYNPGQLQGSDNTFDRWQCASLYVHPQAFEHYFHQTFQFSRGWNPSPPLASELKQLVISEVDGHTRQERLILLLAALMENPHRVPPQGHIKEAARITRIKEGLLNDLSDVPTLDQLAQQENLSVAHLVRSFNQAVGLPPLAWLMQRRMCKARELLRQGAAISQVAGEVGFADQAHFTKAFSRYNALTPGQFRRINF